MEPVTIFFGIVIGYVGQFIYKIAQGIGLSTPVVLIWLVIEFFVVRWAFRSLSLISTVATLVFGTAINFLLCYYFINPAWIWLVSQYPWFGVISNKIASLGGRV
jgi:hypothetical protein